MKWRKPGDVMADFIKMMHASGADDQEIAVKLRDIADHMERRAAGAQPVDVDTFTGRVNRVVRSYVDESGINVVEMERPPIAMRRPKVHKI